MGGWVGEGREGGRVSEWVAGWVKGEREVGWVSGWLGGGREGGRVGEWVAGWRERGR